MGKQPRMPLSRNSTISQGRMSEQFFQVIVALKISKGCMVRLDFCTTGEWTKHFRGCFLADDRPILSESRGIPADARDGFVRDQRGGSLDICLGVFGEFVCFAHERPRCL